MTKQLIRFKYISYKPVLFWIGLLIISCDSTSVDPMIFTEPPTIHQSSEPNLHMAVNGTIYLSWTETDTVKNTLKFSRYLENDTWSEAIIIAEGDNWFVNWADFPSLTTFGDNIAAHYLAKSADDTYAYNVNMKISNDSGQTWNTPFIPHKDSTNTEHGFVSKVATENDHFLSVWLDGRKYAYAEEDSTITKEMTLRAAHIADNNKIVAEFVLDHRVCDCCQTDTAMTNDGPVVIYRDRSKDEIRDIYYVHYKDNAWTKPQPVFNDNWQITGCPVNGPAISAKNEHIAVAWFSAANGEKEVKVAFSDDIINGFKDPIKVDYNSPLGRVDVEILEDSSALVTWMDSNENDTVVLAQKIHRDGNKGKPFIIAKSSDSRSSGFPRIVIKERTLFATWTDVTSDISQIKVVHIDLNSIQ